MKTQDYVVLGAVGLGAYVLLKSKTLENLSSGLSGVSSTISYLGEATEVVGEATKNILTGKTYTTVAELENDPAFQDLLPGDKEQIIQLAQQGEKRAVIMDIAGTEVFGGIWDFPIKQLGPTGAAVIESIAPNFADWLREKGAEYAEKINFWG